MRDHLIHTTEFDVRFSEADPLGIVWHGHYVRYFEDGREAFGEAYNLRYLDFYRQGRLLLDEMVTKRGRLGDINEAFRAMKAGEVARTVLTFD